MKRPKYIKGTAANGTNELAVYARWILHIEEQNRLLSDECERLSAQVEGGVISSEERAVIDAAVAVRESWMEVSVVLTPKEEDLADAVYQYLEPVEPSLEEKFRRALAQWTIDSGVTKEEWAVRAARRMGLL